MLTHVIHTHAYLATWIEESGIGDAKLCAMTLPTPRWPSSTGAVVQNDVCASGATKPGMVSPGGQVQSRAGRHAQTRVLPYLCITLGRWLVTVTGVFQS